MPLELCTYGPTLKPIGKWPVHDQLTFNSEAAFDKHEVQIYRAITLRAVHAFSI